MAETIAVLGLSKFTYRVALGLAEAGKHVLVVDHDEHDINAIKDYVDRAICGDLNDREMMKEVGVTDCQIIVVGMPSHFALEVLVVHFLSDGTGREIIVQVDSEDEAAAIEKVGATRVVFPEKNVAAQLVRTLTLPGLAERIDLGEDAAIVEVDPPPSFIGRSLKGLDLRKKFNVHVIGWVIQSEGSMGRTETVLAPKPEDPLEEGTSLMVLAKTNQLKNFIAQIEKMKKQEKE
jgi:trk system potassium uptake protein TrkA